jgi:hypothetical protein
MSESCYQKVRVVDADGVHTKGAFNCSRELNHEGRHRSAHYSDDATTGILHFYEWDLSYEVRIPTCTATHELSHVGVLHCRLPAGHPLWHFTGIAAWPS